jgi:hypothetical protein
LVDAQSGQLSSLGAWELKGARLPSTLDLRSPTGVFTGVRGLVTATLSIPAGYRLDGDGDVVLRAPLSPTPVQARQARVIGGKLVVIFDRADLDNNVPQGDAVSLTLAGQFLHNGTQKQLTSTAMVRIVK